MHPRRFGRNRKARALRNVIDLGNQLDAHARCHDASQQLGQRLAGALEGRRDEARGDNARFYQAQVVVAEVEQVGQIGHVLGRVQVDAREAQYRLGNDAHVGVQRRPNVFVAPKYP